ncbi:MAG: sulfatase [Bacteroidota bacterium]
MSRVTLSILFLLSLASCKQATEEKQSQAYNIIFILADDFGWADVSYNGSSFYETPNIDRIANEGTIFTNGYASCQVCSPSRASIMTGKNPARHGITDWIGARTGEAWREKKRFSKLLPPDYNRFLSHEDTTIAEAFKENGYQTFFAGKWHLGNVQNGSLPQNHGFNINKGGWEKGSPAGGYFSPWKNPSLENKYDGENLSMRLAKETVEFISEQGSNADDPPFFAFVSFYAVHSPIQTTQEKWSKYRNKAENNGLTDTAYEMGKFKPIRQVQDNPIYGGLVESMDDAIGLVLRSLDSLGLSENTIVVFTSDNGGVAAGDNFSTSNKPLRAGKGYQFEGGIREPFLIKIPGIEQPKEIDAPVIATDFYPTLLDLAGLSLKPTQHQDGMSLKPLFNGGNLDKRSLVWHYPHYGNQGGEPSSIIRQGDWKLIHYYEDERQELYDLKNDLSEETDLAEQKPELVQELSNSLFAYLESVNAKYPIPDPDYDMLKEMEHLEKIRTELLPTLELRRKNMLSPSFDPGNNWWGSTIDD